MHRRQFLAGLGALGISGYAGAQDQAAPTRGPDVIFVPTPDEIVDTMLKMAAVTAKDTVYDLGCGDGRIVITAAQKYGARGVGIDIDPERISEANENVKTAGVTDKVKIHPRRPVRGRTSATRRSSRSTCSPISTSSCARSCMQRSQSRHPGRLPRLQHGRLEAREAGEHPGHDGLPVAYPGAHDLKPRRHRPAGALTPP